MLASFLPVKGLAAATPRAAMLRAVIPTRSTFTVPQPPAWSTSRSRLLCHGASAIAEERTQYADDSEASENEAERIEINEATSPGIDESLMLRNCNLSENTVRSLEQRGIFALFPIQKSVFDPAMAGQDLVARARTGSGKTLAFALPIVESIIKENQENPASARGFRLPRAIVLAPTRELAKQVATEMGSANSNIAVSTVYGGAPIGAQIREIERGVDVVVGTPGRVIDLVQKRRCLDLSKVRFFVLDEADEMLNMGFQEDVEQILESVPTERQTMLFSATMPGWVRKLADRYCNNYTMVDLVGSGRDSGKINSDITCLGCMVPQDLHAKRLLLVDLITTYSSAGKTIVFCNTKRECETVVSGVSAIMPAEALHGDIAQDMREYTMARFREGKTHVLVATDVAARGLDVNNVDLVVHWDVPTDPETYLHRSGRTGRAGNKGTAIIMFGQRDKARVAAIIQDTKADMDLIGPPSPQQVINAAANNIEKSLGGTNIEVAKYFAPVAAKLLEQGIGEAKTPVQVLAVVMAEMSGYKELPKHKSILGQQEGFVTMGLRHAQGRGFPTPGALCATVRNFTNMTVSSKIGKIELFEDSEETGFDAAFDIPANLVSTLTAAAEKSNGEFVVERLDSLPLDLKSLRSYGGRGAAAYGGRGGRGGGGYGRDSRGGRGGGSYGGGYGGRSGGAGGSDRRFDRGFDRGFERGSGRGSPRGDDERSSRGYGYGDRSRSDRGGFRSGGDFGRRGPR